MGTLSRGMFSVLVANIINLSFNLVTNFALPKYLPVESYAAIKTFTLMISYAGVLHFGYEDGMYLKYGGKQKKDIDIEEWKVNISSLRIFQLGISVCILIAGIYLNSDIIFMFSLVLLPYNMVMYYKQFYQAIGEFKLYGYLMNITTVLLFAANMFFIVLGKKQYIWYLAANNIMYFFIWCILEVSIKRKIKTNLGCFIFSARECWNNIRSGFLLMLGNFSSVILTSMDRWFVKFLLNTTAFAEYSFAVSLENFINVAVTPITVTLYNFFCQNKSIEKIKKIQEYVLLFAVAIITAAFPAKFILETWLTSYSESGNTMFLLFCGQLYFILVKSIYVNFYKAQKMQKKYFKKLIIVIGMGFVFNWIFYLIVPMMEAFALGTLLSAVLWLGLCQFDFKELFLGIQGNSYLCLEMILFLICGFYFNAVVGGCMYIIGSYILSIIFMKNTVQELKQMIVTTIIRKNKNN